MWAHDHLGTLGMREQRLKGAASRLQALPDEIPGQLMPRHPRVVIPGQPLHVLQRGNNRTSTFSADQDYLRFLELLAGAAKCAGCEIHAYVLMTNHFHLLVTPQSATSPARMMYAIGRDYVRYFNRISRRTGTLWEGRFRSVPISSDHYFRICSCYIELNPVRAGMVRHPADYRWSSHRANALGAPDAIVTPHPLYLALGASLEARRAEYSVQFTKSLDPADVDRIRRETLARHADATGV